MKLERNHEDRKPGRNTRRVLAEKVVMEVAAVMTGFRAVDAKAFVALAHPRGLSLHAHLFLDVFTDYNSRNEIKKKIPQFSFNYHLLGKINIYHGGGAVHFS